MSEVILLGIVASLIFTELTGLSPGGMVVPAYFVLTLTSPGRMLSTLAMALLCMGTVRLLQNVTILYGRRRYAVFVLSGLFYKLLLGAVLAPSPAFILSLTASIGYVVPGILGRDMERQGILKTLLSLGAVVLLVRLTQIAAGRLA